MTQFVPVMEQILEGGGRKYSEYQVASSVEGRPKGGGDPRVACRDQAGVQDDGSKMSMKSESEMWRLRKI